MFLNKLNYMKITKSCVNRRIVSKRYSVICRSFNIGFNNSQYNQYNLQSSINQKNSKSIYNSSFHSRKNFTDLDMLKLDSIRAKYIGDSGNLMVTRERLRRGNIRGIEDNLEKLLTQLKFLESILTDIKEDSIAEEMRVITRYYDESLQAQNEKNEHLLTFVFASLGIYVLFLILILRKRS